MSALTGESSVQAQPVTPHIFHGQVTVDGQPASASLPVQARIDNVNYSNSFQTGRNTRTESGGTYGQQDFDFHVCGNIVSIAGKQGGDSGDLIEFFVSNVKAMLRVPETGQMLDSIAFEQGRTTRLDLVLDTLSGPTVAATPSNDACKIGDEPPTPVPPPPPPPPPPGPPPPPPPPPPEATLTPLPATATPTGGARHAHLRFAAG